MPHPIGKEEHLATPFLEKDDAAAADSSRLLWTVVGIVAISFWSSSFAASRILAQSLGQITSTGICFTVGGLIATLVYGLKGQLPAMAKNPLGYYLKCGVAFVMYPIGLFIAFHLAHDNVEIVTLTAVNYLWPLMMSLLTVIVMRKKANFLLLGIAVAGAVYSILLVNLSDARPMSGILSSFGDMWQATLWAVAAAYCWASYSVYAAYFSEHHQVQTCVPLFTVLGGLGLLFVRCLPGFHEDAPGPFDGRFAFAMAYMIVVPVLGCRFAWDYACSRGNIVVLTSFAYLTPILATFWNVLLLGITFQKNMAFGSAGLAMAAIAAKLAIRK